MVHTLLVLSPLLEEAEEGEFGSVITQSASVASVDLQEKGELAKYGG